MYVDLIITIRDLRAHGIPCTSEGADPAAGKRHLENDPRDLRAHGIHRTSRGADWAACSNHLQVLRDLRAHGIRAARW